MNENPQIFGVQYSERIHVAASRRKKTATYLQPTKFVPCQFQNATLGQGIQRAPTKRALNYQIRPGSGNPNLLSARRIRSHQQCTRNEYRAPSSLRRLFLISNHSSTLRSALIASLAGQASRDTYPAAQLAPPPIYISQRVLEVAL